MEVLLVVALFALLAAFLVPSLIATEQTKAETFMAHLQTLLEDLSEYSVYSGELMALRINEATVEPMRFESYDEGFVAFSATHGSIKPLTLPPKMELQWQAEDAEQDQLADPQALEKWQQSDAAQPKSKEFGRREVAPELFFYPSGEASPGVLRLYTQGAPHTEVFALTVDTVGRLRVESQDE